MDVIGQYVLMGKNFQAQAIVMLEEERKFNSNRSGFLAGWRASLVKRGGQVGG